MLTAPNFQFPKKIRLEAEASEKSKRSRTTFSPNQKTINSKPTKKPSITKKRSKIFPPKKKNAASAPRELTTFLAKVFNLFDEDGSGSLDAEAGAETSGWDVWEGRKVQKVGVFLCVFLMFFLPSCLKRISYGKKWFEHALETEEQCKKYLQKHLDSRKEDCTLRITQRN